VTLLATAAAELAALLIAAGPRAAEAPPAAAADYRAEIEAWRREREQSLRAPDGWLALVGLTWLHPGANRFGGAPDDDVPLPAGTPPHAGALIVTPDGHVQVRLAPGVAATVRGRAFSGGSLRTDAAGADPDVLALGRVTLQVIARGGRLGARIKDPDSAARRSFAGLAWYPIAPAYRVTARLEPAESARKLVVPDASGGRQELESPGTLAFRLLGTAFELIPVRDGPDDADLLVVFRDRTSGQETYGGGRFLRARRQPDGSFLVDFNRAYSPPCAYSPFATCPLPPPENRLPIAIPAGEKMPPGGGHH
jgi:uncharacterized protein (DUF1684 family)